MLKKAKSQDSVKLLWLEIDVHLKYEANVTRLCRIALNELNTLYHSKAILKQDETNGISHKVFLVNLVNSIFPLVCCFCTKMAINIVVNIQKNTFHYKWLCS